MCPPLAGQSVPTHRPAVWLKVGNWKSPAFSPKGGLQGHLRLVIGDDDPKTLAHLVRRDIEEVLEATPCLVYFKLLDEGAEAFHIAADI